MNKIYTFIPKKTFILILFLLGGILILGSLLFLKSSPEITPSDSNPIISQTPSKISPLQMSVIGKTTKSELDQSFSNKKEESFPNGDQGYLLTSSLDARPNEIQFHNQVASFERIILLGSSSLKTSDMILKYGQAEAIKEGSKYYGAYISTYIYAKKGLAFIANPETDQIYELQMFASTTLDDYMNNYGQDIKEFNQVLE
jgi:hypothetical protein